MGMGARTVMNMAIRPMPVDTKLLTLVQWLSPAYPLGSFSYSHGLEAAVSAGWVTSAETLETWLDEILRFGSGRVDAITLRLAFAADDSAALCALNAECLAFINARERQAEAARQGAAFASVTSRVWQIDVPETILPVAVGYASARVGLDIDMVVPVYLHAFTSNLVSGAQRLMPLGQSDAQALLARLHPVCDALAVQTRGARFEDISSTSVLSDIAAMKHETLEPRLFQS